MCDEEKDDNPYLDRSLDWLFGYRQMRLAAYNKLPNSDHPTSQEEEKRIAIIRDLITLQLVINIRQN